MMFGFRTHGAWAAALVGLTASILVAGPVVIDSDTAVGPDDRTFDGLDIVVRGATLTIDGTHAFASLTLERNGSNQPGILRHTAAFSARGVNGTVLDVSGDVLVQGADRALVGSRIDLDGRGYPGTMGPGAGGDSSNGSWGSGGGGHGGAGGNGAGGFATPGGGTYGSVTMPDEFGSGAGSYLGNASAAGGGAIRLIVGGTLTVDGTITAGGAALSSTAGAGGSIWIDAATVAGTGIMRANGANGQNGSWGGGGGGRIAVIANTLTFDGDLTACGGSGARGGAGTIYRNIGGVRTVIVDNCGNVGENTEFSGDVTLDADLIVRNGGRIGPAHEDPGFHLTVTGDVAVEPDGGFEATGRGHAGATGAGAGGDSPNSAWGSGGAGHGGAGGNGSGGFVTPGGETYGSVTMPVDLGSGGGSYIGNPAGRGGGAIRLTVGGTLVVDGTITADGTTVSNGGAGAGGSIWIDAASLVGSGTIRANGANAVNGAWGGGGGGRIAVYADTSVYTGDLTTCGGNGARGGAGTIFFDLDGARTVIVDNCGNVGENTEFGGDVTLDADLIVRNGGRVGPAHEDPGFHLTVTGDVAVEPDGAFNADGRGHPGTVGPGAGGDSSSGAWGSGGAGHGGAGGNGSGGFATPGGGTYGSVTMPVDLGSGGGSFVGNPAGRGGGAIRLSVGGSLVVDGLVSADGTVISNGGAGAGGSIWIDAASLVGSGTVRANGANAVNGAWGGGGGGRIAVYADTSAYAGEITTCGGNGARGGAGTVYEDSGGIRTVIIDNCGNNGEATEFSGDVTFDADLIVRNAGLLGHAHGDEAGLRLTVTGDAIVMPTGAIAADGRGYGPGEGPGAGGDSNSGCCGAAGGGYGGAGGDTQIATGGPSYGSAPNPTHLGSGSGAFMSNPGSPGGGRIGLDVLGTLTVDGRVSAHGSGIASSGGSGGSVRVRAGGVNGAGVIAADGGNGQNTAWGGGGGGRVVVQTCAFTMKPEQIHAFGGTGFGGGGEDGTALLLSGTVEFTTHPVDEIADDGDTVTFTVVATGDGDLSFQWFRDGIALVDDDRISGATTDTLVITDVECPDSGEIVAIVNDDCGFGLSESATLSVPRLADFNGDCVVDAADLATLLGSWGPCPDEGPCPADLNGDGQVDPIDLGTLLSVWG